MYKYVVGRCTWSFRESAEGQHDLVVREVAMFADRKEYLDWTWQTWADEQGPAVELWLDLNDLNNLSISQLDGIIPGLVLRWAYILDGKLEKARNAIVSRALAILMEKAEERIPY